MIEGSDLDGRSLRLLDIESGEPSTTAVEATPATDDGLGGRAVSWIRATLVEGLMDCACAHQAVHPDLLDCIEDHRMRRRLVQAGAQA